MNISEEKLDRYEEVIYHTNGFDGDYFLLGKDSKGNEKYIIFNKENREIVEEHIILEQNEIKSM